MRVGWGFLLLVSVFFLPLKSFAVGERDNHECALWIEYYSLQERVYALAQKNLPVPKSLRREMQELLEILNSEDSNGATEATEFDVDSPGFEPYVPWSPEGESSEDGDAAQRGAEEKDYEIESEYYSFNEKLARLEELLERRGQKVSPSAIQAIFPRMLATRAYANYRYRFLMTTAGVEDGSLQVFGLALWAHNTDLQHAHLPDERELISIAQVMAVPVEKATVWLDATAPRPAKAQEILEVVAEELDLSVEATVDRMKKFLKNETRYPPRNFGRWIYNFLGANDDLFPIHDTESLDRYLASE